MEAIDIAPVVTVRRLAGPTFAARVAKVAGTLRVPSAATAHADAVKYLNSEAPPSGRVSPSLTCVRISQPRSAPAACSEKKAIFEVSNVGRIFRGNQDSRGHQSRTKRLPHPSRAGLSGVSCGTTYHNGIILWTASRTNESRPTTPLANWAGGWCSAWPGACRSAAGWLE